MDDWPVEVRIPHTALNLSHAFTWLWGYILANHLKQNDVFKLDAPFVRFREPYRRIAVEFKLRID